MMDRDAMERAYFIFDTEECENKVAGKCVLEGTLYCFGTCELPEHWENMQHILRFADMVSKIEKNTQEIAKYPVYPIR